MPVSLGGRADNMADAAAGAMELTPVTATSTSAVVIDITGTGKLPRLELSTREAGSAGR
jgi:hypothetical protein